MPTRRKVLKDGLAALITGAVAPSLFLPGQAFAQDGSGLWDVAYIALRDLDATFAVRDAIGNVLGPDVKRDLRVVQRDSGLFQVIYDRDGEDKVRADTVARSHTRSLITADVYNQGDSAEAIRDEGYSSLYNVSYGVGKNLEALKNDMQDVRHVLGEGVGKNLVIEDRGEGLFALVYRRRGSEEETKAAATRHHSELKKSSKFSRRKGELASFTRENGYDVVAGETSVFTERAPVVNNIQPSIGQVVEAERPTPSRLIDSDLERVIEAQVKRDRQRGRIKSNDRTAWVVFDYTTGELLLDINGDVPMQCASMVKPFVALAFFDKVKREKNFNYGPVSKGKMERMLRNSDNYATNWVIDQVGGAAAVNKILHQRYSNIFHDTSIVEKIPVPNGATYRNKASARDYSRFLYAMWNDNLPSSKELRRLMSLSNYGRVYQGVPDIPSSTLVFNKTGSTGKCIGDFGILSPKGTDGKRYPYHFIGIVDRDSKSPDSYGSFTQRAEKVIRGVSGTVYNWLQEHRHPLK